MSSFPHNFMRIFLFFWWALNSGKKFRNFVFMNVEPICFFIAFLANHRKSVEFFTIMKKNIGRSLCMQFSNRFQSNLKWSGNFSDNITMCCITVFVFNKNFAELNLFRVFKVIVMENSLENVNCPCSIVKVEILVEVTMKELYGSNIFFAQRIFEKKRLIYFKRYVCSIHNLLKKNMSISYIRW